MAPGLSPFLKWLGSMFSVMDSLIGEYADAINIGVSNLLQKFLFRLSVRYVGRRMNTQVPLLNPLVRLGRLSGK